MIKSDSRKSSLLSALKSRRSLKDLSARGQKGSSIISEPISQSALSPNATTPTALDRNNARGSKLFDSALVVLSPLDMNSSPNKRFSKKYFADGQEYHQKRHSFAWKKRPSSTTREVTMASLSAVPSNISCFESTTDSSSSRTIHEKSGNLRYSKNYPENYQERSTAPLNRSQSYSSEFEVPSTPARIYRTINISDIPRFMESDDMLPLNNRQSIELEAHEIENYQSKICVKDNMNNCIIKLVENALVMKFFPNKSAESRYWDQINVYDVLKGDRDGLESAFASN